MAITLADVVKCGPIRIGPILYDVRAVKFSQGHWGQTDFAKMLISLNKSLPGPIAVSTLFHECLHAIHRERCRMSVLTEPDKLPKFEGFDLHSAINEDIVHTTESGILLLLIDNPRLLAVINRFADEQSRKEKRSSARTRTKPKRRKPSTGKQRQQPKTRRGGKTGKRPK